MKLPTLFSNIVSNTIHSSCHEISFNVISPETLSDCTFRGTDAMSYFHCRHDMGSFTVPSTGDVWNQRGTSCVWTSSAVPNWHFTSAVNGNYDVHMTQHGTGRVLGADIVGGGRCMATDSTQTHATTAENTMIEEVCEAFIAAGGCTG